MFLKIPNYPDSLSVSINQAYAKIRPTLFKLFNDSIHEENLKGKSNKLIEMYHRMLPIWYSTMMKTYINNNKNAITEEVYNKFKLDQVRFELTKLRVDIDEYVDIFSLVQTPEQTQNITTDQIVDMNKLILQQGKEYDLRVESPDRCYYLPIPDMTQRNKVTTLGREVINENTTNLTTTIN